MVAVDKLPLKMAGYALKCWVVFENALMDGKKKNQRPLLH